MIMNNNTWYTELIMNLNLAILVIIVARLWKFIHYTGDLPYKGWSDKT